MSHDIAAYESEQCEKEIAYLNRGAANPLNSVIYQALDAMEQYGGLSGYGGGRTFTRAQIVSAHEALPSCTPGLSASTQAQVNAVLQQLLDINFS